MAEIATAYQEGSLPFWARLRVRLHLAMCKHCRALFAQLRHVAARLRELPLAPVADDARAELLRRYRERSRRPGD